LHQGAPAAILAGEVRHRSHTRALLVVPLAAAVLAAACGGSDSNGGQSTEAVSTSDWANSLCSSITTWTGALTAAADSLKGDVSKSALQGAADDVKTSTQTFATDLKSLGPPNTEGGQDAKETLGGLASDLEDDVQKIESAVDDSSGAGAGSVLSAASTVTATLATMGSQATSAFNDLQNLDAKAELESALKNASSCQQIANSGSG
jgi:hypothetical protein